jgi:hypothetical protein
MREALLPLAAAVMMSATAAMADHKSDCQKGIAMIKAELKKKHPAPYSPHCARRGRRRLSGDISGISRLRKLAGPWRLRSP